MDLQGPLNKEAPTCKVGMKTALRASKGRLVTGPDAGTQSKGEVF